MNGPTMNVIATRTVAVLRGAVINREAPSTADYFSFFALHRHSDGGSAAPVRNKNVAVSHSSRASSLDLHAPPLGLVGIQLLSSVSDGLTHWSCRV